MNRVPDIVKLLIHKLNEILLWIFFSISKWHCIINIDLISIPKSSDKLKTVDAIA